jgi:hypothetical protein
MIWCHFCWDRDSQTPINLHQPLFTSKAEQLNKSGVVLISRRALNARNPDKAQAAVLCAFLERFPKLLQYSDSAPLFLDL